MAAHASVDLHRLGTNQLTETDHTQIVDAVATLQSASIAFDEVTLMQYAFASYLDQALSKIGHRDLVVIDDLNLLFADTTWFLCKPSKSVRANAAARSEAQNAMVEHIEALRAIAVRRGSAIVYTMQLNRKAEERRRHRPRLEDLGLATEAVASSSTTLLLYRPEVYFPRSHSASSGETEVMVYEKNRYQGSSLSVCFEGQYARFAKSPDARTTPT